MTTAFIPLITHERILPLVLQLFGSNLQLSTSHLIYSQPDPPGTSPDKRAPGWHRDNGRTTLDLGHAAYPRMGLKCAYYLTDQSRPKSGVTMFLPGSNNFRERVEIPPGQADPAGAIEPSLNPGDCVLFEYRTWHAGAPNFSPDTRKAVMIGYCYQWLRADGLPRPAARLRRKAGWHAALPRRRAHGRHADLQALRLSQSAQRLVRAARHRT